MKILMLGWELPPHNSGGLGVACFHLAKAIASKGIEIDFVVPYSAPHDDIDFMTIHNATTLSPLHKYGMGSYDSAAFLTETIHPDMPASMRTIRDVQSYYTKYVEQLVGRLDEFDAIHAHDWLTMEAGMRAKELTNKPLVVHVHATEFDRSGGNSGNPIVQEIEYQGLMMADRILAVSGITKQIIIEKYGIPADKIEVVHNAIDVHSFDPQYEYDLRTYRYLEGLKSEGYTIFSAITRLTVQKGLGNLVRAMANAAERYDRIALLLAGDGEQRDELIALAAELGIADKVFFTGFVRGKQWRDAYSVSDVFVLSSVSEPFGLTALEAAHHDNALIVTRQSGVGEILESVLRYDFWDVDRLTDQIVGVASSASLRDSLRTNIAKEYDQLSWHDVADRCINQYKLTQTIEAYS